MIPTNSEEHGWKPEVSQWYTDAHQNRDNPSAPIWQFLQEPRHRFQAASWWLALHVISDANKMSVGYRSSITRLVSREETVGSFPFTQFIRELCQNALDATIPNQSLNITLKIDDNEMVFSHDGRPFEGPTITSPEGEMASLYAPGMTTKKGSFNSEGRFGIGFKGWMIFFDKIRHDHSDGEQRIQIGYNFVGDRYSTSELVLKGPEHIENIDCGLRNTSYVFSIPTPEYIPPTVEDVIKEWSPMIRFARHSVNLSLDIMGQTAEITHEINTLETLQHATLEKEIFESSTQIELSDSNLLDQFQCNWKGCKDSMFFNHVPRCPDCDSERNVKSYLADTGEIMYSCTTQEECEDFNLPVLPDCDGDDGCGDNEHVIRRELELIAQERIIGIRSQIMHTEEITTAVNNHIREEQQHYSTLPDQEVNPWNNVTPNQWYEQTQITLAVNLNQMVVNSPWLFSMAEITSADEWPGTKFHGNSRWLIDGPFFLSPTRKELKNDEIANQANAALLKFALSQCAPALAHHLHGRELLHLLNKATPFDGLIEGGNRTPSDNAFHAILWDLASSDDSVIRKNYTEVFGGRSIYQNYNGELINANIIRRIPSSWKVGIGMSLSEWLQDKEDSMQEYFDFIPRTEINDISTILDETNTPLAWTIPEMENARLYGLLADSNLLQQLADDHPSAVQQDWYKIPIDEDIKCFIFGNRPMNHPVLNQMAEFVIDSSVKFVGEDEKLVLKYRQKQARWIEVKGIYCLTVPSEATVEWWINRFIERLIRDGITLPDEVIESVSQDLNLLESCSYFVAKGNLLYSAGKPTLNLSQEEFLILPKNLEYRSNWTILSNSLSAWSVKNRPNEGGLRLWKSSSIDNFEKLVCNGKFYPGPKKTSYFCTQENNNNIPHGVFNSDLEHKDDNVPACPICHSSEQVNIHMNLASLSAARDVFVMMGEPFNSAIIVSSLLETIENYTSHNANRYDGIIIASPYPITEVLHSRLNDRSWTKIPYLTLTNYSGTLPAEFSYNDLGFYNQEGGDAYVRNNWGDNLTAKNNRTLVSHIRSFYGHAHNLHTSTAFKQKNVLTRDIGGRELFSHPEFIQQNPFAYSSRLNAEINQSRFVEYARLSASLLRLDRRSSQSPYDLKFANIRTSKMRATMFDKREIIPYDETLVLKEVNLSAFTESPISEPINWFISPFDVEDFEAEWEFFQSIEALEIVPRTEIKVKILPEDKDLLTGLCRGVLLIINEILEQESEFGIDLLVQFSKMISYLDLELLGESNVFAQMEACNSSVAVDQKNSILDLLERALEEIEYDNDRATLTYLRASLQGVQAQTWNAVESALNDLETDEEKWRLFLTSKMLPPHPAVFQYRTKYQDFKRGPEHCRIGPNYAFTKVETAKALFNVGPQSTSEDAGAWTISGGNHRVCILPTSLLTLLECEAAAEHTIGDVNFEGVLHSAQRNPDAVEIHPQWGFAQLLIGLRAAQLLDEPNFEDYIPQIGQREMNHSCQVFSGKPILLGKGGWDICVESIEEDQSGLHLVTQNLEVSPKGTLLQLLKRVLGVRLPQLTRMSIENDESIELLASYFGIDGGELNTRIEAMKRRMTGTILNPWNGNGERSEAEKWDLKFGQKPEWQSDKNQAIERGTARRLLKRYTDAIRSLLHRGDLGAARNDDTQKLIRLLGNVRDDIKTTLYQNVGSLLVDEPIIYPPGEVITEMGNLRRKREGTHAAMLEDSELRNFTGNLLFLSRFSTHRGTMYTNEFGLKERTDQTIQSTLHQILNHANAWGSEETVLLRDVMQIGPNNYLSLRLHKYHALCMVALDDAFDTLKEEEE